MKTTLIKHGKIIGLTVSSVLLASCGAFSSVGYDDGIYGDPVVREKVVYVKETPAPQPQSNYNPNAGSYKGYLSQKAQEFSSSASQINSNMQMPEPAYTPLTDIDNYSSTEYVVQQQQNNYQNGYNQGYRAGWGDNSQSQKQVNIYNNYGAYPSGYYYGYNPYWDYGHYWGSGVYYYPTRYYGYSRYYDYYPGSYWSVTIGHHNPYYHPYRYYGGYYSYSKYYGYYGNNNYYNRKYTTSNSRRGTNAGYYSNNSYRSQTSNTSGYYRGNNNSYRGNNNSNSLYRGNNNNSRNNNSNSLYRGNNNNSRNNNNNSLYRGNNNNRNDSGLNRGNNNNFKPSVPSSPSPGTTRRKF